MQGKVVNNGLTNGHRVKASDFILSTFNPRVAVFSTPAASAIAAKSNLTVTQLLSPFTRIQCDVSWHEPLTGQLIVPKGLSVTPVDVTTKKKVDIESQPSRRILQDSVTRHLPSPIETEETKFRWNRNKAGKGSAVEYNVEAPKNAPWFTSWRGEFLRMYADSQNSQYDFLHHYVACFMVMTSSDGQTPEEVTETVAKLSKLQQQHQAAWANTWAFPSVLKFYLVLHEATVVDQARADAMYQNLRTTYGGNFCFMVHLSGSGSDTNANDASDNSQLWGPYIEKEVEPPPETEVDHDLTPDQEIFINSDLIHPLSPDADKAIPPLEQNGILPRTVSLPVIRGQNISLEDMKNLQIAVNEFANKALLPYIDRQSRLLHESIVNRRGMSKSFFNATKRLFGGSAKTPASIVYTHESLEMMSRKLADIYFLFGHYAGSYQLYHQLKKDFFGDSAWIYYASALEMAAVSHFMMSQVDPPLATARAFPVHYITDAITYLTDTCRMTDTAMKCALVCCECLKQLDNYSEAAAIYIKMTSEDCDMKSALMLEQAAYSFLQVNYVRKYALHCVLAGHRYLKAGLKLHSLKCYLQANQIYTRRGWRFAQDHVNFTITRLLSSVSLNNEVTNMLETLVKPPPPKPIELPSVSQSTPKLSLKSPYLNSLKVEYTTLKLINSTSYLGLLRINNVTSDGQIAITKVDFSSDSFQIQSIYPDSHSLTTQSNKNGAQIANLTLVPMESKNVILRIQNLDLSPEQGASSIRVQWTLTKPGVTYSSNTVISVDDLPGILKQQENSFIFEVNHTSRCDNDFSSKASVFHNVEVLVHSRVSGSFVFKLEKNHSPGSIGPGLKSSGDELFFLGRTTWALDVSPRQTYHLKYRIGVMQPGVYNVAPSISVSASPVATGTIIPRKYLLHSPLIVAQKADPRSTESS